MVASGIVTEINRGLDIKTEVLNTITVEDFTKDIAARIRLISSLILWGVIFVTAPPDEPSGEDARIRFNNNSVRITIQNAGNCHPCLE